MIKLDSISENEEPNLNYSTSSDVIVEELKNNNEKIKICNHPSCNRKLKITDYECKCNKIFCRFHKNPEDHECKYDYKESNNKQKKIDNMKCISNKLQKIN